MDRSLKSCKKVLIKSKLTHKTRKYKKNRVGIMQKRKLVDACTFVELPHLILLFNKGSEFSTIYINFFVFVYFLALKLIDLNERMDLQRKKTCEPIKNNHHRFNKVTNHVTSFFDLFKNFYLFISILLFQDVEIHSKWYIQQIELESFLYHRYRFFLTGEPYYHITFLFIDLGVLMRQ